MKEYQVELLSPAGNMEAFLGAIHAGADAVYLGGNKYGARAYADNFSTEELIFCIRYAHLFGRKVYLTVNTLMKEAELHELGEYLTPFYEAGLDACIVQDFGAFKYIKSHFPQMELHASTQMTITGVGGAGLLKEMGATRIVPARELSLEEIKHIKRETGLELETFIHGAMCYCYSGQCLFSSMIGGRSGNRGRCAQPCRLPYQVNGLEKNAGNLSKATSSLQRNEEYYPLSLKDMCTIEHIEALMDAGIDSFKIEGRMKKPEYTAGVTAIYRKYIDLKKKHPDKALQFKASDLEKLSKLYIRSERQDGYYFKQNGKDMVTLTSPAYSGSDEELLKEIRKKYIETKYKLPISIYATFMTGENAMVTYVCNDLSVTVAGDVAESAKNMPTTAENIEKQLKKLGDSSFEAESIEVYTDGNCFYPVKSLNELRRKAVELLEDKIIESHGFAVHRSCLEMVIDRSANNVYEVLNAKISDNKNVMSSNDTFNKVSNRTVAWTVHVTTKEQLSAVQDFIADNNVSLHFKRIYIESELLLEQNEVFPLAKQVDCYIALPYCMRHKDEIKIKELLTKASKMGFKGFLIRNVEEYGFLQENGYLGEIRGDAGLYIWNSGALDFWKEKLSGFQCPIELNRREWCNLFIGESIEKLVYGRIPMMVTANCVAKTTKECIHGNQSSFASLKDRYNKVFPVSLVCAYCMNIIYNSVPLSLHKELMNSLHEFDKKLQFTVENKKETLSILNFFKKIALGELTELPFKEYTTGHEKRGVL